MDRLPPSGQIRMKAEWRHHLDELLVHTDAILRLSHDLYERKIEYTADDKAELMVLGFASRQDGHLRAIQDLVRCGHHSDATLVARTAFEGAAQLTWAVGESPNRPETWFWYGIFEDWRQTKVNRARGIELSAEQQAVLDEALREWGDRYLTDKARKRVENGQPPIADPYRRKWADLDLASICRELDASWSAYYNHIYRTFSDWVHWSPRSLFLNVEFENGNATGFRKEDPHSAAIALKVGEFALFQTLRILDWKFGLKIDKQIMALHDKFTLEANKVLPPPFK